MFCPCDHIHTEQITSHIREMDVGFAWDHDGFRRQVTTVHRHTVTPRYVVGHVVDGYPDGHLGTRAWRGEAVRVGDRRGDGRARSRGGVDPQEELEQSGTGGNGAGGAGGGAMTWSQYDTRAYA